MDERVSLDRLDRTTLGPVVAYHVKRHGYCHVRATDRDDALALQQRYTASTVRVWRDGGEVTP